jgi:hypothetical protein
MTLVKILSRTCCLSNEWIRSGQDNTFEQLVFGLLREEEEEEEVNVTPLDDAESLPRMNSRPDDGDEDPMTAQRSNQSCEGRDCDFSEFVDDACVLEFQSDDLLLRSRMAEEQDGGAGWRVAE